MIQLNEFIAHGECWRTLKSCGWSFKRNCSAQLNEDRYVFPMAIKMPMAQLIPDNKGTYYFDTDSEVHAHVRYYII